MLRQVVAFRKKINVNWSIDQLTSSPQHAMVTCLTHGDGFGGRSGELDTEPRGVVVGGSVEQNV